MTPARDQETTMTTTNEHDQDDALAELLAVIRRCPWCSRYLCTVCGQPVPKRDKARWTDTRRIVCLRSCDRRGREAHAILFPDCPDKWHDVEDHSGLICTTGGLRRMISEGGLT
jgi:hypothetical protein